MWLHETSDVQSVIFRYRKKQFVFYVISARCYMDLRAMSGYGGIFPFSDVLIRNGDSSHDQHNPC